LGKVEKRRRNLFLTSMFFNKQILLFSTLFFLRFDLAFAANSDWIKSNSDAAETRLLASFYEENGAKKLIAGVEFKVKSGWKIYGPDAGGIGMPPNFDFSGSKNYSAHQIIWPEAEKHEELIGSETFRYSAYHQDVVIPINIDLAKIGETTNLTLNLEYGVCKDVCIPASAKFSLDVDDEIDVAALQKIQQFYPQKIIEEKAQKTDHDLPILTYIFLAFLGGLILNIMPCVLPVLSIKLLSIINHPNAKIANIRLAFLSTILGILSCFIVFALIACIIKFSGNELGWGLQFQNAKFLAFLVLVVGFFTANLFGKFEITFEEFLATFLNKKINEGESKKNIFLPNFLSGILATLLATPCSAPFLGSAISFALVQSFAVIFLISFFIGLGFCSPYILLFFSPKLINFLPKPGMWMIKLKQFLALLMLATWFWLLYIISSSLDPIGVALLVIISLSLPFCLKIHDRIFKIIVLIVLVLMAINLPNNFAKKSERIFENSEALWLEFDEQQIQQKVREGRVVLVDVTADWCITCKFNKINVLHSKELVLMVKTGEFIGMRGDITKPNPKIMEFMRKHGRFAIPFNIVYGPNAPEGILTSELLNKDDLIKLIQQAQ